MTAVCHCRNCQRYTGSAFEPLVIFPASAVTFQGQLQTYNDVGDSGRAVHRRFCPNCGSGVVAEAEAMPGMSLVLVGTLDDPSAFTPGLELYCSSAQPWVSQQSGERKKFDRMPA